MTDELKYLDENWDNKTSTFQSRLDLKLLAEVTQLLTDHMKVHTTSISGVIKHSLYILIQIGRKNGWCAPFDTYRDAWLYLHERGLYAFNKAGKSSTAIDDALDKEKVEVPIMRHDVERIGQSVEGKSKGKDDMEILDDVVKSKDKIIESLKEDGLLADTDNEPQK